MSTEPAPQALRDLVDDYTAQTGPFVHNARPSDGTARQLNTTEACARYLTFGSALDYQRPADRHWREQMLPLWNNEQWVFEPESVIEAGEDKLSDLFEDYSIQYFNRDAGTWVTIAHTLIDEFNGQPAMLLEESNHDAQQLLSLVQEHDGLPFLGGTKIAPMWVRFMHDHVHELTNLKDLVMPVDTQVVKVTNHLWEADYSRSDADRQEIRDLWRSYCREHDIAAANLDRPFWLIGNQWRNWGKSYLDSLTGDATFRTQSNLSTFSTA